MSTQNKRQEDYSAATLELKHPIQWGSEIITELRFRKMRFTDLKAIDGKNEMIALGILISRLTNTTPPIVDEMDVEDVLEAGKVIMGFMPQSRKVGDSGSEPSQEE